MQIFVAYTFDNKEKHKIFFKNKIMVLKINDLSEITEDILKDLENTLEAFEEDIGTITIINYKAI